MLRSELFAGDPLLEAIAADQDRISRFQHPTDSAVRKLQTALLFWDPECLPVSGADGTYGDETASAVVRFKVEVIGVPAESVIDDVGPQTVRQLDAMLPGAGPAPQIDPEHRGADRGAGAPWSHIDGRAARRGHGAAACAVSYRRRAT